VKNTLITKQNKTKTKRKRKEKREKRKDNGTCGVTCEMAGVDIA
jgi:hypothetical protein